MAGKVVIPGGALLQGRPTPETAQDVGNLVCLEHINLNVPAHDEAIEFFIAGLGLTRDPYLRVSARGTIWVNAGCQQLHLPRRESAQVLDGEVTLVVPSLERVASQLKEVAAFLAKTQFAAEALAEDAEGLPVLRCVGPHGNRFRVVEHGREAAPWGATVERPFQCGISMVTVHVAEGLAPRVARFYHEAVGAFAHVDGSEALVRCGPAQQLRFLERPAAELRESTIEGGHLAVYVANFSLVYDNCVALGVAGNNPAFSDVVHCLADAQRERQFRFQTIVDVGDPARPLLLTLEHEVRSLAHPSFMRPLVNRHGHRL